MLRLATIKDTSSILRLLKQFHLNSVYKTDDFDEEKVQELVRTVLSMKQQHAVIFLIGEPAHGVLIGMVSEWPMSRQKIASELAWWVEPEMRNSKSGLLLFKAYEYWAKNVAKADKIQAVSMPNISVNKLYEKKGYSLVETVFVKDIKWL